MANVGYYLARLAAGTLAALKNKGEIRHFSTPGQKVQAAWTMLRADWAAVRMIPATWRNAGLCGACAAFLPKKWNVCCAAFRSPAPVEREFGGAPVRAR